MAPRQKGRTKAMVRTNDSRTGTFERKGGYPSASVPRSQMRLPAGAVTKPKPQSSANGNGGSRSN